MNYEKITHIDLFSGIGGFALAADRVFGDVKHIFCDNEPFAQEVLKKHWPTAPILKDIRTFTNARGKKSRGLPGVWQLAETSARESGVFILTGGFPCQPFSQAGRRKGEEDDRFLWPEMARVIKEFKPEWVIAENVRGLLTQGGGVVFERVCTDLESLGYEVQPIIIPAVAVGAPHRRDRVWFIAHRKGINEERPERQGSIGGESEEASGDGDSNAQNSISKRSGRRLESSRQVLGRKSAETKDARPSWETHWLEVATRLCRVDDGIPRRVDRNPRLKALGNAIVPQVAEEIMKAIKSCVN